MRGSIVAEGGEGTWRVTSDNVVPKMGREVWEWGCSPRWSDSAEESGCLRTRGVLPLFPPYITSRIYHPTYLRSSPRITITSQGTVKDLTKFQNEKEYYRAVSHALPGLRLLTKSENTRLRYIVYEQ